ncbi:competence protein ComK [Neobacillus niacini]|uniref:competence protein ComK n=1 Tax=Neobacillus niacini TaxID=86668 RepID=UPI0030002D9A
MCPIVVNPYQCVCLFPTKSPQKEDCIWFNPDHIVKTKAAGTKTIIELSNGHTILVDSKLFSFNNKIEIAIQLKQLSSQRGNHPTSMTLYLKPKKGLNFTKNDTGIYNFIELEKTAA